LPCPFLFLFLFAFFIFLFFFASLSSSSVFRVLAEFAYCWSCDKELRMLANVLTLRFFTYCRSGWSQWGLFWLVVHIICVGFEGVYMNMQMSDQMMGGFPLFHAWLLLLYQISNIHNLSSIGSPLKFFSGWL
jgi:hypothetical protein